MIKILLPAVLLITLSTSAQSKISDKLAKIVKRHNESCVACHIVEHDIGFYTRENTRMHSLADLHRQVNNCTTAFRIGWSPEEEAKEAKFLNQAYYLFDDPSIEND